MAERAMPSFTKSPPELVERFGAVLDDFPEAERRRMFGYPAAFVGGNLATSLFHDRWVVRLPDDELEPAKADGAAAFEPMPGKPMKGFVLVPSAVAAGVVGYASDDVVLLPLPVQPARLRAHLVRFSRQRERGSAPTWVVSQGVCKQGPLTKVATGWFSSRC